MNTIPSSYTLEAWIFATSAGIAVAEQGQQTPQSGWHTTLMSFTGTNTINVGHFDGSHQTLSLGSTYSLQAHGIMWFLHTMLSGDTLRGYVDGV